mgnify:CR=1 FL=1
MLILNTKLYNPASNSWGFLSKKNVNKQVAQLNNFGNVGLSYCPTLGRQLPNNPLNYNIVIFGDYPNMTML